MCLYPKLIKNRKYIMNKKNGGNVPVLHDNRTAMVPVGCQKCMECRNQKARQWQIRLMEEVRNEKNGKFVTLTFSNESIKKLSREIKDAKGYELDNAIATLAVRRFLERWRKKYKKSVRHWLITELGHTGTEHLHMHGIIWTDQKMEEVENIWQYGWVWKGKGDKKENYVNEKTVNYLVKYVSKQDRDHEEYNPKILTSPGIGRGYTERLDFQRNQYKGENTDETYKTRTGHKIALPIYWRNKAYTDEEKEKLWIQKLDKNERWVLGTKIDISKGEDIYYKALEYARSKNKRLGYGDDKIDWDKKAYENARRQLKIEERKANTQNGLPPSAGEEESNRRQWEWGGTIDNTTSPKDSNRNNTNT